MIYNEDYGDMGIHHDDCNIGTSYKYGGRGANSNNNSGSSGDGRRPQQQQHTQQQERYPVYDSDGDVGSQMEPGEAECSSESEDMAEMVTDGVMQQQVSLYSLQVVYNGAELTMTSPAMLTDVCVNDMVNEIIVDGRVVDQMQSE